ncbi:hypothetical protein SO802_011417 [Lithocarpus litseifolius]|uniref:Uncharacterized protein n=1 Tax=Lithocarpus litseifolius TaxID=425828 RepID=A0AAW2D3Q9_9ROSI
MFQFKAAGPWLRPGYENLPPGIFKQPDGATNVNVEPSGQQSECGSGPEQNGTHERASPEFVSRSVQGGTTERLPPTSCYTHQDHCTSPLPSQNTWQPHDIRTSMTSVGTCCTTPIQAESDSPQEPMLLHHNPRTKANSNLGLNTKSPARSFRNMFCLTPVQVGLKSIEEHVDLSSTLSTNLDNDHSPTHQQSLSKHSESLTPQSTTFLISPYSSSSVTNQELHQSQLHTQNATLPPPNPLKRKVNAKELELLAKRLKITARGPEPVFFDPETVTLIPQASLEYFILKESQRTDDEVHKTSLAYTKH